MKTGNAFLRLDFQKLSHSRFTQRQCKWCGESSRNLVLLLVTRFSADKVSHFGCRQTVTSEGEDRRLWNQRTDMEKGTVTCDGVVLQRPWLSWHALLGCYLWWLTTMMTSVSAQDGHIALRKACACSVSISQSHPKVALETVSMLFWLNTGCSKHQRVGCQPLSLSTGLSFRQSVL